MPRDRRRFGARRDAKRALSQRRTPSASPSCPSGDPARSNRRFRRGMQPPRLAENSRKCTARPGGPVRAVKNTLASKSMRTWEPDGGKDAKQWDGIPDVSTRALQPPRVSRKPHALRRCRIAHPPYQPFAQNGNAPSTQIRERGIVQIVPSVTLLRQRPSSSS